jgi:hypothetical protein
MKPLVFVVALVASGVAMLQATPAPQLQGTPQRDAREPTSRQVPVGTASISGVVVDAATGRPVAGARVTLTGQTEAALERMRAARDAAAAAGPSRGGPPPTVMAGGRSVGVGVTMTIGPSSGRGSTLLTASRAVLTDRQGAFAVSYLPAGRYDISVSQRGYLDARAGQKTPAGPGVPLRVGDGETASLTIPMVRGGVISGIVYGDDGAPVTQASVQVWRWTFNGGARRLQQQTSVQTDDRGMYRIHGLQPGTYIVSARPVEERTGDAAVPDSQLIEQAAASGAITPPAAPGLPATVTIPAGGQPDQPTNWFGPGPQGFLPVFHPSAASAPGAAVIRISGGDEHSNTDINLILIRASRIEGVVTNMPGNDHRVQISLINDQGYTGVESGAVARPDGSFVLTGISPGTYTLQAQTRPRQQNFAARQDAYDPSQLFGRATVRVAGEATIPASVTLAPGRSISGVVHFNMERRPDLATSTYTVRLTVPPGTSMSGPLPSARVEPDGRFTLAGVPPGRFGLSVSGPWTESVLIDGRDVLDDLFEVDGVSDVTGVIVNVTDQVPEVSGTVTPAEGFVVQDYMVVIVPTEERYWVSGARRAQARPPDADGYFTLRGLPPGTYMLAAVTDLEQGAHQDPEFMRAFVLQPGEFVTVTAGGRVTRNLRGR